MANAVDAVPSASVDIISIMNWYGLVIALEDAGSRELPPDALSGSL